MRPKHRHREEEKDVVKEREDGVDGEEEGEDYVESEEEEQEEDQEEQEEEEEQREGQEQEQEQQEEEEGHTLHKKPRLDFRLPTHDEMMRLRETEDLFRGHTFHLEIQELLKEVKVNYTKTTAVEAALHHLRNVLVSIPTREITSDEVEAAYPGLRRRGKGVAISFLPPSSVDLVGSYLVHTVARPELGVDVAVCIPNACLQREADHLDHRYGDKRLVYLGALAQGLAKDSMFRDVQLDGFRGDATKPILSVHPDTSETSSATTRFTIRVFPCISHDALDLKKLRVTRTNVRYRPNNKEAAHTPQPPTPHYSNAILEDVFLLDHLPILHRCCTACPTLVDAIILAKVWLRQRGMTRRPDSMNGFLFSMLLAHLFTIRRITKSMSAYQILRIVMQFIADTEVRDCGIVFGQATPDGVEGMVHHLESFDIVFLDSPSKQQPLNLAGRVSHDAYEELRHEAKRALNLLSDSQIDGFLSLFTKPVEFATKHDSFVCIRALPPHPQKDNLTHAHAVCDLPWRRVQERAILRLMKRAMSDRCSFIRVDTKLCGPWKLQEEPPRAGVMTLGLHLNEETANRIIDQGPRGDEEEKAAEFRQFWGKKAELRRFKDGVITEAVVWMTSRSSRHNIIRDITRHILLRHTRIRPEDLTILCGPFDSLLQINGKDPIETTPDIIASFDNLVKKIKAVKNMPLEITLVQPIDAAMHFTAVFPPISNPLASEKHKGVTKASLFVEPMKVVMHFESSSRWPTDLEAVQNLKAALFLRLAEGLRSQFEIRTVVTKAFLDVLVDGYVFRFLIFHEGELRTLKKSDAHKTDARQMETELVHRPIHASSFNAFHLRFLAYSSTVRLAKRWIDAHMFGSFITAEAVELLAARVFTNPGPFTPPHTATCGLLRFLQLLASYDWQSNPLIIDVDGDLTAENIQSMQEHFNELRATTGSPELILPTKHDSSGTVWTHNGPDKTMLKRMKRYASRSVSFFEDCIHRATEVSEEEFGTLFVTPLHDYNLLISLDGGVLPRVSHPSRGVFKTTQYRNVPITPSQLLIGFDPAEQLVQELRERFGRFALFFHSQYGENVIAVLWRPTAFLAAPFKISNAAYRMPVQIGQETWTIPNVCEIVNSIKELGEGIVTDVKVVKDAHRLI